MRWFGILFLSFLYRVDGFVSVARATTKVTTAEDVFKRLASVTAFAAGDEPLKETVPATGMAEKLSEAFKARVPANASYHKWDSEAWKKNVTNWALDAREKIHQRFLQKQQEQKDKDAKRVAETNVLADKRRRAEAKPHKHNATSTIKEKKKNGFEMLVERAKASGRTEDILLLGSMLDLLPITLTAIAPGVLWIKPVAVGIWYLVGTAMYMIEGDMDMLSATSMIMQIETTIGWGSNCLTTDAGKLFTTLHMFIASLFISPTINAWCDQLFTVFDRYMFPNSESQSAIPGRFFTNLFFLVALAGGVAGTYAYLDTTGSGKGTTDAWVNGVYLAIVSLSTIGYGDLSPTTPLTMGMGLIWGSVGTRLFGHVMGLADQYFKVERFRRFGEDAYNEEAIQATGKTWAKASRLSYYEDLADQLPEGKTFSLIPMPKKKENEREEGDDGSD